MLFRHVLGDAVDVRLQQFVVRFKFAALPLDSIRALIQGWSAATHQ